VVVDDLKRPLAVRLSYARSMQRSRSLPVATRLRHSERDAVDAHHALLIAPLLVSRSNGLDLGVCLSRRFMPDDKHVELLLGEAPVIAPPLVRPAENREVGSKVSE
jgi:hypothetical protein